MLVLTLNLCINLCMYDLCIYIQLRGAAKVSNTHKIHQSQNITLRQIMNAPPFVSNYTLH